MEGVNLTPSPSKSHVWCLNMTTDTLLESSYDLLLEFAKKNCKIAEFENFMTKVSYIVWMFAAGIGLRK